MLKSISTLLLTALIALNFGVASAKDVQPISGFYKTIASRSTFDGNTVLFNQYYPTLGLSTYVASRYPNLARAINNYNRELLHQSNSTLKDLTEQARQYRRESPQHTAAFYSNSDLVVRRADTAVFSLINDFADYSGGAHGMYGWTGVNFDSGTGKRLEISDVCTNADRLVEAIISRLRADYDERAFDDLQSKVTTLVAKNEINFVIEPRGVTFIFNPYEIAPYASGLLTATILFSEQPTLFKDKYRQTTNAFAQSLTFYFPTVLDMNGRRATFEVINERDNCTVILDGVKVTANIKNAHVPTYVHTASGRNFLYVDGVAETDGFSEVSGGCLTVFKLDGDLEMYDRIPYTLLHSNDVDDDTNEIFFWIMTDPNAIQFDSPAPVADEYSHFGAIADNGVFAFG